MAKKRPRTITSYPAVFDGPISHDDAVYLGSRRFTAEEVQRLTWLEYVQLIDNEYTQILQKRIVEKYKEED